MANDVDMPVRQAGVIYLKNLILTNWADKEADSNALAPFSIHEQDRAMIRDAIVDATVHAPELIRYTVFDNFSHFTFLPYFQLLFTRVQLAVCISNIAKHDFPSKWTQIVDKITVYLQNPDITCWPGVLLSLYQLVKIFE